MKQKILLFSGKKESGKNTLANFLQGLELLNLGFIKEFEVSSKTKGELWVKTHDNVYGRLDLSPFNPEVAEFASKNLWPFIKQYSFADDLKHICMNILLLNYEQCFGTNEQKNSYTKYHWENMPGLSYTDYMNRQGPMTAREIMQYVGTEIFRKIYSGVWVEACLNRIQREASDLALITDCRFPEEVSGGKYAGAKVIRLTRNINPSDTHSSETSLDVDNFDWSNFDYILDNQHLSIENSCKEVYNVLKEWGWLDYEMDIT